MAGVIGAQSYFYDNFTLNDVFLDQLANVKSDCYIFTYLGNIGCF